MPRLLIGRVSPATSIQDFGRSGWQRYGVAPAGALDVLGLAVANALVQAPAAKAAIEVGPLSTQLLVLDGAIRFAVAGATRRIRVAERLIPVNTSALASAGDTIDLGPAIGGVFSYLAVCGGIWGDAIMDSMSVHARAGLGSPFPRPLASGDILECGSASIDSADTTINLPRRERGPIRVVLGPQDDYFGPDAIEDFFGSTWRISPVSDRMAYRLIGPQIRHVKPPNIISDGTVNGCIQIPGSGQPLVLHADRGTTGGYPKLAVIISSDIGRFAQAPIGANVTFVPVDIAEAQAAAVQFRGLISSLGSRVSLIHHDAVGEWLGEHVADAAVNAHDFDDLRL